MVAVGQVTGKQNLGSVVEFEQKNLIVTRTEYDSERGALHKH